MVSKDVIIFGKNSNIGSVLVKSFIHDDIKLNSFGSRECNFLDKEQCLGFFKKLDRTIPAIIFLPVTNKLLRNDYRSFLDNITMINNFVNAQSQINIKQIIFFSSVDVYGATPRLPISEETIVNPELWYGMSKYCSERILQLSPLVKCPVTILRLPGIYGNPDNDKSVIGKFICDIKDRGKVVVYGSGSVLRDYIHVDDVAAIVKQLIRKPYNGVLNFATGSSKSLLEIISILEKYFSLKFEVIYKTVNMEREFDLKFDISKIKLLFPEIKFKKLEDGIMSYAKVYNIKGDI
jgi:nucleoside-diphosphate-sugar epimerase